ncbi:S-adenosyl-L-methionine-dependent methyltransferase [Gigaspora margarita]|uniref:S-adenosyl-L-methionine-dependent methyltransferase n=1 Tax=Gigaspora margarita TaxID=4874 RepID=A0A8H4B5Q6_GIGMA|nr:S-adenosyl-L-methionine-dependent methyltransferase [Gigaspora margarita]
MSHHSRIEKHESTDFRFPIENENSNDSRFYLHNVYEQAINGNVGAPIPFPDNEFDYVIFKYKALTMEKDAFQKGLSEIIRILKPGGESWLKTYNVDYDIMMNFENYLQETGKPEYISHKVVEFQTGSESGHAFGEFMLEQLVFFFRNTKDHMAPFMNISFEEFDSLMNNIESELNVKDSQLTIRCNKYLQERRVHILKSNENTHTVFGTTLNTYSTVLTL